MPAQLWSIRFSPWSVRARWALLTLGYKFNLLNFVKTGPWGLRFRFWRWKVTVPALIDGSNKFMDGKEMVEHAQNQRLQEDPGTIHLIKEGVEEWLFISNDIMELERSRLTNRALEDKEFRKLAVPKGMKWIFKLGPLGDYLLLSRIKELRRKYDRPYNEQELVAALTKLKLGVESSKSGYLMDTFSFADICAAVAIDTVKALPDKPVAVFFPPHEELSFDMSSLCAWRDNIVDHHWPKDNRNLE